MPLTRSRPKTEQKFLSAVLELLASDGCAGLGINAVAQRAGSDKVLIYRYFNNLNGLLQRAAESRQWLPSAQETINSLTLTPNQDATDVLQQIARVLIQHIRADAPTRQLVCWYKTDKNPLTEHFAKQWLFFWGELHTCLASGLNYASREDWRHACSLTALAIEAEICDQAVDLNCFKLFAEKLPTGELTKLTRPSDASPEERLPTNLL